jgi:hypothetical protein
MSSRKALLRITELVALMLFCSYAAVGLALALGIFRPNELPTGLFFTSEGLVFVTFLVSVMVLAEYSRIVRPTQSRWSRTSVSYTQAWVLLRWCPWAFKATILPIVAVAFVSLFWVGHARWSGGPMTAQQVAAFTLGDIAFCGITVLVCASASRMPGSFAEVFEPAERA